MKQLEIFIDGASQGNPGPSGIGVVIRQDAAEVKEIRRFIGHATNNYAEYTALLVGLQEAEKLHAEGVLVKSDSQLLCRQLKQEYRVRHPVILELYTQARRLIAAFKDFGIEHIPRTQNAHADRLATQAIRENKQLGKR